MPEQLVRRAAGTYTTYRLAAMFKTVLTAEDVIEMWISPADAGSCSCLQVTATHMSNQTERTTSYLQQRHQALQNRLLHDFVGEHGLAADNIRKHHARVPNSRAWRLGQHTRGLE